MAHPNSPGQKILNLAPCWALPHVSLPLALHLCPLSHLLKILVYLAAQVVARSVLVALCGVFRWHMDSSCRAQAQEWQLVG